MASAVTANYVCPANTSMTDAKVLLAFGYTIQDLIEGYYRSVPNTATNIQGLTKQATLGAEALMMTMSGKGLDLTPPECPFAYPRPLNGTAHLMNAFYLEATLCGAFIGLGDYFQSPTLNSLSTRLAAEHGIHASALRAMMQLVGFRPNSTMLTPAFTPVMILRNRTDIVRLGSWLGGCISSPMAPCGGTVSFGPLLSNLTGQCNTRAASRLITYFIAEATETGALKPGESALE